MSLSDDDSTRYALDLPGAAGGRFTLESRRGKGPTIVVFFRGHWCPYCRRYLGKLQGALDRLKTIGDTRLVAISTEPADTSAALARELALSFPILRDADGDVIDRYGVRNGFRSAVGLIHPAVFVFDSSLRLRFRSIDRNYKVRTSIRTLIHELESIAAAPV